MRAMGCLSQSRANYCLSQSRANYLREGLIGTWHGYHAEFRMYNVCHSRMLPRSRLPALTDLAASKELCSCFARIAVRSDLNCISICRDDQLVLGLVQHSLDA